MFKKIIITLVALSAVVLATAPVSTSGVNYDNYRVVASITKDTVAGTALDTLISGLRNVSGEELVLVRAASTNIPLDDSCAISVSVQATDGLGNLIYSVAVDSFTTIAGEAVALPRVGGEEMRITLKGYGANKSVHLNGIKILARKVLTITKPWDQE
jgi:hypothetical protein